MANLLRVSHDHKKLIIVIALIFLICNSYYNLWSVRAIKKTQLEEKYIEIKNIIDTVAAAVNADAETPWQYHERNIISHTENIDCLPQVFAAAYRYDGQDYEIITNRTFETSVLNPFDYEESGVVFGEAESGRFEIGYTPTYQNYRVMQIYYRWMPSYTGPNEKYLMMGGVTEYSIQTSIPLLHSIGQWISTVIVTLLFLTFMFLDTTLGHWWIERGKDHYREKN